MAVARDARAGGAGTGASAGAGPNGPARAPGSDDSFPKMIDRYELLKKLATGGMAEIFLAKQSGLEGFEKVVVLKRILGHLAQDEEFVSMFLDEARIAAKLSHPNIVQIYDLGKSESSYYIAMEYVSGRNVQHLMMKQQGKGGSLPVEHVCRIMAGVCDGLYYAHSRKDYDGKPLNIIHRDISPQNILVSFAGGVKVVDFGIAKATTQLAQTRAGVLKGKYAYMSPEQVRGAKIDHRSDLFAVGLVMYEMLTGQRAFERDSSLKTLKAIVQEKPLNPRELNPDVPMEVVKLLSKALEKNPDRRYKTAQEMQLAIEDFLESSPKKSNNVRLSRYMYELFDDELNSADGTMVVKGVGEVIIPTSQGAKQQLQPRIEEEIDSKTLSAALLPDAKGAAEKAGAVAPRVEKGIERSAAQSSSGRDRKTPPPPPTPGHTGPHGPVSALSDDVQEHDDIDASEVDGEGVGLSDESDDGRTIPAFDVEDYEKKRAAKKAGVETSDEAPTVAGASGRAKKAADDVAEQRTVGGVPPASLFEPSGEHPAERDKPAVRGGLRPSSPGDDKRAAELLAKVEAMAGSLSTAAGPPEASSPSGAAPRWEGRTGETTPKTGTLPDSQPLARGKAASPDPPSMIVGPNGKVSGPSAAAAIRPAAKGTDAPAPPLGPGGPLSGPSASTLPSMPRLDAPTFPPSDATPASPRPAAASGMARAGASVAATPTMVLALIGFTIAMCVLSVVAAATIAVLAMGGGDDGTVLELGLLTVTTEPPGATVIVDGEAELAVKTPAQLDVPLEGEHKVRIEIAGKPPLERTFEFAAGTTTHALDVKLE